MKRITKRFVWICIFILLLCGCQKRRTTITFYGGTDVPLWILSADYAFEQRDYETALSYYQKIEEYYDTYNTGRDIEKAILFNSMGQCYYSFPDIENAILYFEKSSGLCEKIGDDESNFNNYWYLADLYNVKEPKNSMQALEYGRKAQESAERFYGKESSKVGKAYMCQGEVYMTHMEFDKASECFEKAREIVEKAEGKDSDSMAYLYFILGEFSNKKEEYEEALAYYQEAEKIFEANENYFKLGQVYRDKGGVYTKTEEYEEAIATWDKCIELYEKNNIIDTDLGYCHFGKALVAAYLDKKDMAEEEFVKVHKIYESQSGKSKYADEMIDSIKEQLEFYYKKHYEEYKNGGFEIWYEKLITE